MSRPYSRIVAGIVALSLVGLSVPAQAVLVDTPSAAPAPTAMVAPARSIESVRTAVRAALTEAGLAPDEANARAAALSDAELSALPSLDREPAGRGIVGVAVFVFAVLIMTDVLGLTKIFPFTRSRY